MNFLRKALGKVKNFKDSGVSAGEQAINTIKNFAKTKIMLILGPVLVPLTLLLVLFLVIASVFGEKLNLLQLVDPNSGGGSSVSAIVGNGIYSEADFEDAVNVTHSVAIAPDYDTFASKLSGTDYKNIENFNASIKANAEKAGWGTRQGVVAAVMAFAYEYAKATGFKYFFNNNFSITMREGVEGVVPNLYLDCRAFVQWAVYNGGFNANELNYIGQSGVANIAPVQSDVTKAQPGDIFSTPGVGHTWIVIGLYDGGYYAAEEFGYSNGLVINKYSWDNAYGDYPSASLYDMSGYYGNSANVRAR